MDADGLLAACIIAGANPKKCYGIELDEKIAKLCIERLSKLGILTNHIKVGNALESSSYNFNDVLFFKIFNNKDVHITILNENNIIDEFDENIYNIKSIFEQYDNFSTDRNLENRKIVLNRLFKKKILTDKNFRIHNEN